MAKYYIVIGRHPKPKLSIALNFEDSDQELSERVKHEYVSILGSSLFEQRSDARFFASYLEEQGYIDVAVCAVVPLKKFVREPIGRSFAPGSHSSDRASSSSRHAASQRDVLRQP